jgi:methylenetetrahydrofolate dehydrogenase (NADP+)/methenyltetrahydrofolate cyclohydrolase
MTIIFDGQKLATKILARVKKRCQNLPEPPTLATLYFAEDPGSVLYTQKKQAACQEIGAKFLGQCFSFATPITEVLACLEGWAHSPEITGLMVQKPRRVCREHFFTAASRTEPETYDQWWQRLITALPPLKDVDGLSPATQNKIALGQAQILPATVNAVVKAVTQALPHGLPTQPLIIGRTDLLGLPLTAYWRQQKVAVTLVGRVELARLLAQKKGLTNFDVIVSAIGQAHTITADKVKAGVIIIDVGEPHGDFAFTTLASRASFITPVPGGIGPLTVACLLENLIILAELNR